MSKEQVMDYVMNSPANTNPNVLSGMLDGISGTQLPSPTESDNGKVLGVDGGEYKLVEQSGGAEVEIIKLADYSLTTGTDGRGGTTGVYAKSHSNGKPYSLAEMLNGKTAINVVIDRARLATVGADRYCANFYSYKGDVRKSIVLAQSDDTLKDEYEWQLDVSGAGANVSISGSVYAVCI